MIDKRWVPLAFFIGIVVGIVLTLITLVGR